MVRKLPSVPQLFVKKFYAEFHEYRTNYLVLDTSLQTDGRKDGWPDVVLTPSVLFRLRN